MAHKMSGKACSSEESSPSDEEPLDWEEDEDEEGGSACGRHGGSAFSLLRGDGSHAQLEALPAGDEAAVPGRTGEVPACSDAGVNGKRATPRVAHSATVAVAAP